jgi:hypothetical protein
MTNGRSSLCAASFHTSAEKTTEYIQNRRHIIGHWSFVISHFSLHRSLTPSPSPKERGITPREAILWFLKFQTYQKKILREYSHGVDRGDSPLLWRGARGEANRVNIFSVNISNDNKKNSNITHSGPTIEIVGFDVKGSSASRP